MTHWLSPLLSPKSIAIVGASERPGSLAASTWQQLCDRQFEGDIYPVNPKYTTVYNRDSYASLADLPVVPDLVVYAISGLALEASFEQAMSIGVGGVLIYASNYLDDDPSPRLPERLKAKAAEAGIPVCGGNSMGFYNYDDNVFVSFDRPPEHRPKGHIGLIAHSGSGFTYLANNDERFCFNYVIASAQETNATVADYIDYLLDQDSTRVITVLLEAVRDVPAFIIAIRKAQAKNIPVLITKLARTEKSAGLALSHSGAIVGDHDAFVAACERHGVVLCRDIDEMIVTAMLFSAGCRFNGGKLASILDSGGMREQMIDIADDYGVAFGEISEQTRQTIDSYLDSGLVADNPLDAMGALARNVATTYLECGKALLDDNECGLLTFEFEFRDGFSHYPALFDVVRELADYSDKSVVVVNSCTFTSLTQTARELVWQGIPVINGIDVALRSLRNLREYRSEELISDDFNHEWIDRKNLVKWKTRLCQTDRLDEQESLKLMADFNLPVVPHRVAQNLSEVLSLSSRFQFPLVMKTAEADILHKSDCGGVILGISDETRLRESYRELQQKIGGRVVIMPMLENGVEVSLGMKHDPDYGPLIIIASGGILVELIRDRVFACAPLSYRQIDALLERLKLSQILDGVRGRPAADRQGLIELIQQFSELVYALGDSVCEIDLNPVMVLQQGCTIVDALVISGSS